MINLEGVAKRLLGRSLIDIVVPGYIDNGDDYKRFHPMFDDVYFDFDGLMLRTSAVAQYWYLRLEIVDRIAPRFELEDDDEFGICSLDHLLERPGGPHSIQRITAYTEPDRSAGNDKIVCAAFEFGHAGAGSRSDVIFLDPRNTFGIHVRTRAALAAWQHDNAATASPLVERVFSLDATGNGRPAI